MLDYGPDYCRFITQKSFEYVKKSDLVKTVVLASNWPAYYAGKDFQWVKYIESKDSFKSAFEKTIHAYQGLGKNVVVFLASPVGSNPRACVIRPIKISGRNSCNLALTKAIAHDGYYREYFIPFLQKTGIGYFDPFEYLCNIDECKITENGKIFNVDTMHISEFGGEFLARQGQDQLRQMFLPRSD